MNATEPSALPVAMQPAAPPRMRGDAPSPRRFDSRELLAGDLEIEIEHGASVYRLRRTSLGKLILTK